MCMATSPQIYGRTSTIIPREPPLATKRIALRNPVYNESLCKGLLEELVAELLDTPLPPLQECLHVKLYF